MNDPVTNDRTGEVFLVQDEIMNNYKENMILYLNLKGTKYLMNANSFWLQHSPRYWEDIKYIDRKTGIFNGNE